MVFSSAGVVRRCQRMVFSGTGVVRACGGVVIGRNPVVCHCLCMVISGLCVVRRCSRMIRSSKRMVIGGDAMVRCCGYVVRSRQGMVFSSAGVVVSGLQMIGRSLTLTFSLGQYASSLVLLALDLVLAPLPLRLAGGDFVGDVGIQLARLGQHYVLLGGNAACCLRVNHIHRVGHLVVYAGAEVVVAHVVDDNHLQLPLAKAMVVEGDQQILAVILVHLAVPAYAITIHLGNVVPQRLILCPEIQGERHGPAALVMQPEREVAPVVNLQGLYLLLVLGYILAHISCCLMALFDEWPDDDTEYSVCHTNENILRIVQVTVLRPIPGNVASI